MKKNILLLALSMVIISLCSLTSCKDDTKINYKEKILGTWITDSVYNTDNLTDNIFVIRYTSDMVEMYADSYDTEDGGTTWIEQDDFSYYIEDDCVVVEGTNVDGTSMYAKMEVKFIDDNHIHCTDVLRKVDGVVVDNWEYTMVKEEESLQSQIEGVWKCDNYDIYVEYFPDGLYDFYYLDDDSNWAVDDSCSYFLYGDYIVKSWISRETGLHTYDCWKDIVFYETNGMMTMVRKVSADKTETLTFVRDTLPTVD